MKARILVLSVLMTAILALVMLSADALPATAQRPSPTPPLLYRAEGGAGSIQGVSVAPTPQPARGSSRSPASTTSTGGPDQFGYTWDDTATFNWVDVTAGTNTGLTGTYSQTAAITLPFSFKYYENTFDQFYISTNGTLGFDSGLASAGQQSSIPNSSTPNNVIAPYWAPEDASTGGIYYTDGGTTPNRWVAVEWSQVEDYGTDSRLTFEAVLYENGDILFQYQTLIFGSEGSRWASSTGIEDSLGIDGLMYSGFPSNGKAILFTRPPSSARLSISPLTQGRFTVAGRTDAFQISIRNTGDLVTDTYDLVPSSAWTAALFAADGETALGDSNGNSTPDTGPLASGGVFAVTVRIHSPALATVGDANAATIAFRSTVDPTKIQTATLQTAIPARFAQVYRSAPDNAMGLYLIKPDNQTTWKATADGYDGYSPAIAELPNGNFFYAWYKSHSYGSIYTTEIEYAVLDHSGTLIGTIRKLSDNSAATIETVDSSPVVAVAPNGRVGVLWSRESVNSSSQSNYNVFFAILNWSGSITVPAINVTNNSSWGTDTDLNVPQFNPVGIAATGDSRFVLGWGRYENTGTWSGQSVWYSVRNTDGGLIKNNTQLATGDSTFHGANRVSGNAAVLTWRSNWDIYYAVVNSSGNLAKSITNLTSNSQGRWSSDAVSLPNGNTAIAWINYDGTYVNRDQLALAILDSSYNRIAGPTAINNPVNSGGNDFVSVTADAFDRVILTWKEHSGTQNLYYALADSSAAVLTQPMIYRSSSSIVTSSTGYGNTPFTDLRWLFLPFIWR